MIRKSIFFLQEQQPKKKKKREKKLTNSLVNFVKSTLYCRPGITGCPFSNILQIITRTKDVLSRKLQVS